MAETKILNLASFEDVETLKQTTKSQGEEISQVKQDFTMSTVKKNNSTVATVKGNVDTITTAEYDNCLNVIWNFHRTTSYVGLFIKLADAESILTKKYRMGVYNPNDINIYARIGLSNQWSNWSKGFTIVDANLRSESISTFDIDGSKTPLSSSSENRPCVFIEIISKSDLNKDVKLKLYMVEVKDFTQLDSSVNAVNAENAENAENAKNAVNAGGSQALGFNNFFVRDVVPEGGTTDLVTLTQEDYGYIRVSKKEGLGTKYAGVYARVQWSEPEDLKGLWHFDGNTAPIYKILNSMNDWNYGIDLSNYGNTLQGYDLEKAVSENERYFTTKELWIIPYMNYNSNGVSSALNASIRVRHELPVKGLVTASQLTEQLTEQLAEQLAEGNIVPANAGYFFPPSSLYARAMNTPSVLEPSPYTGNGEIIFNYYGAKNVSSSDNRLWIYCVQTLNVTQYVGRHVTISIKMNNSNYSGNDADSFILNKFQLSSNKYSWGDIYVELANRMLGNPNMININLDDYYDILKDKESTYLLFGVDYSQAVANEDGTFSLKYPPTTITLNVKITSADNEVIATELVGFDKKNYYTKNEIDEKLQENGDYITTWGDSLTAGGGWNSRLAELAGMTLYNGGTGGENARTIVARQGADMMTINNIVIPSDIQPVTIATRSSDGGIKTEWGYTVTPLLQGGAHVNPCKIGNILGTLKWTGANYADMTGIWTFTRKETGEQVKIDRPTAIRTDFDMNRNSPYLMVIFIGQNGGYNDLDDLVRQHKMMIEHASAKHTIILGLSSGSASSRKSYEDRMKQEFGRYFISLREYLAHPIYGTDGKTIVSCYGLADQGLEPGSKEYNGVTYNALDEIATGTVPHQILQDHVHYTTGTKDVIGTMLYKKCCELNIF